MDWNPNVFLFFWKLVGSVDSFVPKDLKTFRIYFTVSVERESILFYSVSFQQEVINRGLNNQLFVHLKSYFWLRHGKKSDSNYYGRPL